MTPLERQKLADLLLNATPGPWVYMGSHQMNHPNPYFGEIRSGHLSEVEGAVFTHIADTPKNDERDNDFNLIVAAVNALPALLEDSAWCERLANDRECELAVRHLERKRIAQELLDFVHLERARAHTASNPHDRLRHIDRAESLLEAANTILEEGTQS